MISKTDYIEEVVEKTEKDVYGGSMPLQNKQRLRDLLSREYDHWEKEAVREDSHSAVGDWNGMR